MKVMSLKLQSVSPQFAVVPRPQTILSIESIYYSITASINPCPQIVMAGKSISDMGKPVVFRWFSTGSCCQSS